MQTVKLYPSATEYQRANDDEVPLSWAVDYLRKLLGSIPNAEQASAVLRAGLRIRARPHGPAS